MELSSNAIISGRYRAERRLGSGAMGEVWTGVHVGVGVKVALKRLLPAGSNHHESLARFKREAYLLGRVRSDYVARVLDFVDDPTYGLVLVMELVEGASLYELLNQRRFTVEEAIDLGCDILNGLTDLHEAQIVHRDLKPGNIIVEQRTRGRQRARLVDFGMSRVMQGGGDDEEEMTGITRADVALGTLEYMAPEQMLNSRGVTGSADLYAVGVILYRAVAGHHAYRSESDGGLVRAKLTQDAQPLPTGRNDATATGYAAVVARALRRKPAERYAAAEEMLHDLEALRDSRRPGTANFDEASTSSLGVSVEYSQGASPMDEGPVRNPAPARLGQEASPAPIALVRNSQPPPNARHMQTMQLPAMRASKMSSSKSLIGWVLLAMIGGIAVGVVGVMVMRSAGVAVLGFGAPGK
jgi:serine/threonine-protein kinase